MRSGGSREDPRGIRALGVSQPIACHFSENGCGSWKLPLSTLGSRHDSPKYSSQKHTVIHHVG